MPVVLALLWWWTRLARRRIDPRLKLAQVGGSVVVVGALVVVELWLHFKPAGVSGAYKWGELSGVLAVYLMSVSLLLATRARWLEPWFGGLDRMYLWHRRLAITGTLLLLPHAFVTGRGHAPGGPAPNSLGRALGFASALGLLAVVVTSVRRLGDLLRIPYQRWLVLHRFTGLFLITGMVHGVLLDRVIGGSSVLMVAFVAISVAGATAYAYCELLRHRIEPRADYAVTEVSRLAGDVVEIHLAPSGPPLRPRPGQFVFLRLAGRDRWGAHPFSVSAAEPAGGIRLSVRAAGRETRAMHERLAPGARGAVTGPHGMFDYTLGGRRQLWIAGGIGIAPFLAWLEALSPDDDYSVDLFYSVRTEDDAVYLAEVISQARRLHSVRVHPVLTAREGRLTAERVLAAVSEPLTDLHAFLCGPERMVDELAGALRRRGLPCDHAHFEEFRFR